MNETLSVEQRKALHDEAYERNKKNIEICRYGIAFDDLRLAALAYFDISEDDRMDLWLSTTNGGCFSTAERKVIKDDLRRYWRLNGTDHNGTTVDAGDLRSDSGDSLDRSLD